MVFFEGDVDVVVVVGADDDVSTIREFWAWTESEWFDNLTIVTEDLPLLKVSRRKSGLLAEEDEDAKPMDDDDIDEVDVGREGWFNPGIVWLFGPRERQLELLGPALVLFPLLALDVWASGCWHGFEEDVPGAQK